MSSVAGLIAIPNEIPYIASKWGIIGATKAAALEYASQGIRVNAVCPGGIRTKMFLRWLEEDPAREKLGNAAHPIGRIGEPREIGDVVTWLCSEEASFVTGAAISVDGGFTLP
jgi:NAD(P)-dependent dehydrogenase (short-subunit alcohol dehydrogenase family)